MMSFDEVAWLRDNSQAWRLTYGGKQRRARL